MIVREARTDDAARMVELIAQLKFDVDALGVAERLARLEQAGEPVLLAETGGEVVGLLDWHIMHTIHRPRPVGRIVALVVADGHRGKGIGKALVAEAEARMGARNCEKMEVTSNLVLVDAHAFYEALGLERSSLRFFKEL